jgi:hypothetical protein
MIGAVKASKKREYARGLIRCGKHVSIVRGNKNGVNDNFRGVPCAVIVIQRAKL